MSTNWLTGKTEHIPMWQRRMRGASHRVTWALGRRMPITFPMVFVLGFPKSGTTWACQLLADVLQLPFPRYSLLPVGCPAVVHGHELVDSRYPRGVYVMRDGRDALVSMFHFSLRLPGGVGMRGKMPSVRTADDWAKGIPELIESMTHGEKHQHWGRHVTSYLRGGHNFKLMKYEDLLADGPGELARVAGELMGEPIDPEIARSAVDRYAFARQTSRKHVGEGSRLLRKGQSGDWRRHFTREAAELFDHYHGEALVEAGYEPDRSWVQRVGESQQAAAG